MDCYGNGYCMADNTCQCMGGFTGTDCNDGHKDETDSFVTDYNIDEEEVKEEEDELSDEEELANKDPKCEPLEKEIDNLKKLILEDNHLIKYEKLFKNYFSICTNTFEESSGIGKWCQRGLKIYEDKVNLYEKKLEGYKTKIEEKRVELYKLMTERQKELYLIDFNQKHLALETKLFDKWKSYLERSTRYYTWYINYYKKRIIPYYERLIKRTNRECYKRLVKTYKNIVVFFEKFLVYIENRKNDKMGNSGNGNLSAIKVEREDFEGEKKNQASMIGLRKKSKSKKKSKKNKKKNEIGRVLKVAHNFNLTGKNSRILNNLIPPLN